MFDKITSRIGKLCYGLNKEFIDPVSLDTTAGKLEAILLFSCPGPDNHEGD